MVSVSLLGIPHDDNSSFMKGPSEAPPLIRRELNCDAYSLWSETGVDLGAPGAIADHGDIEFDGATDAWDVIEGQVGRTLESGGPLICLGGDHAITHPIMRAVRRRNSKLTILHVDAHPDIYHAYQDNPRSHASPFARIMEERLADRLIQVGLRTINGHHREQFKRFGVEAFDMRQWSAHPRFELSTPVYLSVDLDGLDPAFAPGVSHREPGGPSVRQVLDLIQGIDQPIVGADIVEYNPRCDLSNVTATVAAKLVKEIAGMMVIRWLACLMFFTLAMTTNVFAAEAAGCDAEMRAGVNRISVLSGGQEQGVELALPASFKPATRTWSSHEGTI